MENKPALTSEQRLTYIGDMADIETREFTMQKAVHSLEQHNQSLQEEIDLCHHEYESNYQEYKAAIAIVTKKMRIREPQKPQGFDRFCDRYGKKNGDEYRFPKPDDQYITVGGIIGRFFAFLGTALGVMMVYVILLGLIGAIIQFDIIGKVEDELMQIGGEGALVAFYIALFGSITFCIVLLPYILGYVWYRKYKKAYYMYRPYIEEYKEYAKKIGDVQYDCDRLAKTNQEKEKSEQLYELTRAKNSALIDANNAQIALLQKSIQSLHSQKQDLYSIGIIPPDYRQMDCVIMLHQIFRNGLKDNMADAILLYEERVFRQEVIRGIDKIYNMLGRLNDSMRAIESRLLEVKQELQMIGSDMSNQLAAIADNQSRILSEMEDASEAQAAYAAAQEQWQREQLAETRASRYAAEAVQRSNEKFEWYMDQHRRGFM